MIYANVIGGTHTLEKASSKIIYKLYGLDLMLNYTKYWYMVLSFKFVCFFPSQFFVQCCYTSFCLHMVSTKEKIHFLLLFDVTWCDIFLIPPWWEKLYPMWRFSMWWVNHKTRSCALENKWMESSNNFLVSFSLIILKWIC